jgi:DNA-binding transcriptional ArsR family regulator
MSVARAAANAARRDEVARLLDRDACQPGSEGWMSALARVATAAVYAGDEATLKAVRQRCLRAAAIASPEDRAVLAAFSLIGRWGVGVLVSATLPEVGPKSYAAEVLRFLVDFDGASNTDIEQKTGLPEKTEVSRQLGKLAEDGLVRKRRVGRTNAWSLTARGFEVAERL